MKLKLHPLVVTIDFFTFAGCGIIGPFLGAPPEQYAELRLGDSEKTQLLIHSDRWYGVVSPEGGGTRRYYLCRAILQGSGPVYTDPTLFLSSMNRPFQYQGTITIDREHQQVTIDLQGPGPPGSPQTLEPCVANGSYPISSINHDPFLEL